MVDPDAERAEIDLDPLDALFAAGARTLLLTQPHNPWGRVFTRAELEGIRDVVPRHGARVVSDEIHAPLVLPGAEHVPYLSLDGTADHAVAVVAASKAFNTPGLQVRADHRARPGAPGRPCATSRWRATTPGRTSAWSAAIAAYTDCDDWLAALVERLDRQRDLLVELLAEHLPEARMRPLEATYLAWLDLRAYGHDDPAAVALEHGRVRLAPGHDYQPGLPRPRPAQHRHLPGPAHRDRAPDGDGARLDRRQSLFCSVCGWRGDQVGVPARTTASGCAPASRSRRAPGRTAGVKPSAHSKLSMSDHV